jgi:hypothetical protein
MDDLPKPPMAPDQWSCCHRGCSPCIFDYYDAAFADWEAKVREQGFAPEHVLAHFGQERARRPW